MVSFKLWRAKAPETQPAAALRPRDVVAEIPPPSIAIRPSGRADRKLERSLERIRTLRTRLMQRAERWRAQPYLHWLEGRPEFELVIPGRVDGRAKKLKRWCDIPTPVLIQAYASLANYDLSCDGSRRNVAGAIDMLVTHAATADGIDHDVRRFIIQHLAELVERQHDLRCEDDAALLLALKAHHHVRKAHRDVKKQAMSSGQQMVPVPGDPRRLMPLRLTVEQKAHIAATFRRRNELLGVK